MANLTTVRSCAGHSRRQKSQRRQCESDSTVLNQVHFVYGIAAFPGVWSSMLFSAIIKPSEQKVTKMNVCLRNSAS